MTKPNPRVVAALARSFLAGEQSAEQVAARGSETLGRRWRWLDSLAQRYIDRFKGLTLPRHREVVQFLSRDRGLVRAWARYSDSDELRIVNRFAGHSIMQPVAATKRWDAPVIESVGILADWLGVSVGELEWFADLKGIAQRARTSAKLTHYNYRVVAKRQGGFRLIESPQRRLKELQRQILRLILDRVPAHPAVHGFVRSRSIQTFARPHVGQRMVLRMDLQDFFPSIQKARVQTIFRTIGYPEAVADLLGGVCTNAAPHAVWRGVRREQGAAEMREARDLYARSHLPQGAPTSPALANFCAYRVDCRLTGLAKSAGAWYARYADDLAFSGGEDFMRVAERFHVHVAAVLMEEGFAVNHRKTRMMRRSVRQHLAGLVVNDQLSVRRVDFDRLKAILKNCVRRGPESQNRDGRVFFRAHLDGRVGFVESVQPAKGRRLRGLFDQIQWP